MRILRNANNTMSYTNEILACDSCGGQYESGFLTEIEGLGLFCHHCFKPAFAEYFTKHPEADYLLIRGVSSLAYRRKGKDV